MIRVLHHPQPGVAVDRAGEAIDLEGRRRHHGQHVAVAGVHHDHRAGLALHRALGRLLHAAIDGGDDLGARVGLGRLDQADLAAHRVDLDPLAAVLAPQELVEEPLEAGLPDHVAAAVPALLELVVVGLADVAEEVGGEAARRVRALRLDLHDHARQLELPLLHAGHLVDAQAAPHAHRQDGFGRHAGDGVLELGERDLQQRGQPPQRDVALHGVAIELARDQRQGEGRTVVDQRQSIAIEQDAARGRDGPHPDAILLRRLLEAAALEDLQVPELADDDQQRGGDETGHRDDATSPRVRPAGHPAAEVTEPADRAHRLASLPARTAGLTRRSRWSSPPTSARGRGRRPGSRCTGPAAG